MAMQIALEFSTAYLAGKIAGAGVSDNGSSQGAQIAGILGGGSCSHRCSAKGQSSEVQIEQAQKASAGSIYFAAVFPLPTSHHLDQLTSVETH